MLADAKPESYSAVRDADGDLDVFGKLFGRLTSHGRSCGTEERPGCTSGGGDEANARHRGSSGKNKTRASGSLCTLGKGAERLGLTWCRL